MKIEYTKINLIYEQNNDKVHNFYYIYYGRIYNEEHTKYKKFKYIDWFYNHCLQNYCNYKFEEIKGD